MSDTSSVSGAVFLNTPNVKFARPEVVQEASKWRLIRDCLAGEKAVKQSGDMYLPRPNSDDSSDENKKRYQAYLQRAVFYNVTRRTLDGLVGQVFIRDPVTNLPDSLTVMSTDVDGQGVALVEQSKKVLSDVVSFGRLGMLVDYPETNGGVTQAQQEAGYIRPTINVYQPEDVINWRTVQVGARRLLSLVVLQELWLSKDDGFQATYDYQWRVLRLREIPSDVGESELLPIKRYTYVVEIWREVSVTTATGDTSLLQKVREYIPLDASGAQMSEIPFTFVGSINNDTSVDPAPLYDLAVLNIAHYRNSADYEESCFLVGQPTVYASGLTESWVDSYMKEGVRIGSRTIIPLPVGATAGLLQVDPNTLPKEAMDQKEKEMVALGARLVEQRAVAQTLGEAQQKEAAQTSILASVAKNVSAAYTRCLRWCASFIGPSSEPTFELNTDFIASQMTPEERAQLVAEWQSGAISRTEMRNRLRKAGVATQDDATAESEAKNDKLRLDATKVTVAGMKVDPNTGRAAPQQNSKTQQ